MSYLIQNIIVFLLFAGAIAYLWKKLFADLSSGCSSECTSCGSKNINKDLKRDIKLKIDKLGI